MQCIALNRNIHFGDEFYKVKLVFYMPDAGADMCIMHDGVYLLLNIENT